MNWKRFLDEQLEEWVLIISFIALILLVFIQVLSRYVINFSFGWTEELSRYLLIWITWISASYAIRKQEHIRIDVVKKMLPASMQKGLEVIVVLLWSIFAAVLTVQGTKIVMTIKKTGQISASLEWPMWVMYLILPIGGLLMGIRLIQQLYFILTKPIGYDGK